METIETVRVLRDGRQKIINKTDVLDTDQVLNGSGEPIANPGGGKTDDAKAQAQAEADAKAKADAEADAKEKADAEAAADAKAKADAEADAETIVIPEDWAEKGTGKHLQRIALAKKIRPDLADTITKDDDAIKVIEEALKASA